MEQPGYMPSINGAYATEFRKNYFNLFFDVTKTIQIVYIVLFNVAGMIIKERDLNIEVVACGRTV